LFACSCWQWLVVPYPASSFSILVLRGSDMLCDAFKNEMKKLLGKHKTVAAQQRLAASFKLPHDVVKQVIAAYDARRPPGSPKVHLQAGQCARMLFPIAAPTAADPFVKAVIAYHNKAVKRNALPLVAEPVLLSPAAAVAFPAAAPAAPSSSL
jgi:hypothetical protein